MEEEKKFRIREEERVMCPAWVFSPNTLKENERK
jgi:hypothetical protein